MTEIWDLWIGAVGATGMSFARSKVEPAAAGDRVLVHAAPRELEVDVRSAEDGRRIARGQVLRRTEEGPMSWLVRDGDEIRLEEGWPTDDDLGRLVILPGGEAGILTAWWHADDRKEWRWSVEFTNSIR